MPTNRSTCQPITGCQLVSRAAWKTQLWNEMEQVGMSLLFFFCLNSHDDVSCTAAGYKGSPRGSRRVTREGPTAEELPTSMLVSKKHNFVWFKQLVFRRRKPEMRDRGFWAASNLSHALNRWRKEGNKGECPLVEGEPLSYSLSFCSAVALY